MKKWLVFIVVIMSMLMSLSVFRQERKVLFEQYTGTWCGWCPYGYEILEGLLTQYNERIIPIVYHSRDDLITDAGDEASFFAESHFSIGLY